MSTDSPAIKNVKKALANLIQFWKDGKYKLGYIGNYKKMVATRKFFDSPSWDHLQKELESLGEFWLGKLRKDGDFKEFSKLQAEYDRLEVLLK